MKKILFSLLLISSQMMAQHPLSSWSAWTQNTANTEFGGYAQVDNYDDVNGIAQTNCLRLSVFNSGQWSINAASSCTSNPQCKTVGSVPITFTVVMAANSLGQLSSPDAYIGFVEYDGSNNVTKWDSHIRALPSGSFGWTAFSVTFFPKNKQAATSYIKPRIFGNQGGGEIFIYDVSLIDGSVRDVSLGIPLGRPLPVYGKCIASTSNIYSDPTSGATSNDWYYYQTQTGSILSNFVKASVKQINSLRSLSFAMYADAPWSVYPNKAFPVAAGQSYTFTAVIAGNSLGYMSSADAYVSIATMDVNYAVTNWGDATTSIPVGSFGWRTISKTITIPSNDNVTKYIKPRFWGNKGGGELYVAYASLISSPQPTNLCLEYATKVGTPVSDLNFSTIASPSSVSSTPNVLPNGWVVKSGTPQIKYNGKDLTYLSIANSSGAAWELSPSTGSQMNVVAGTDYTIIASLSSLAKTNGAALVLYKYNSSNGSMGSLSTVNLVPSGTWDWNSGVFKWQISSSDLTGVHHIVPGIKGAGTGTLFISGLSMLPTASANANFSAAQPSKFITLPSINIRKEELQTNKTGYKISGWTAWNLNGNRFTVSGATSPVQHVSVRSYNSDTWFLSPKDFDKVPVVQGEKWHFKIVCATRNLGRMFKNASTSANDGGFQLGFWLYDANGNGLSPDHVFSGTPIHGSNGWAVVTGSITIDANTKFILPTVRGWGGGEFFLYSATLTKGATAPADNILALPSTTELPPAGMFIADLQNNQGYEEYSKDIYDLTITSGTSSWGTDGFTKYGYIPSPATSLNFAIRNVLNVGFNYVTNPKFPFALTGYLYYNSSTTPICTLNISSGTAFTTTDHYDLVINSTNCPACFSGSDLKQGFYQLKIAETRHPTEGYALRGYGSAMVGETSSWAGFCTNQFGLSPVPTVAGDPSFIYKFLGVTWDRPLEMDFTKTPNGTVDALPDFSAGYNTYATTCSTTLASTSFRYNYVTNPKYCNIVEIYNEPSGFLKTPGDFPNKYVTTLDATNEGFASYNSGKPSSSQYTMAINVLSPEEFDLINTTYSQYNTSKQGKNLYSALTIHPYQLSIYNSKTVSPEATALQADWPSYDAWGRKTGNIWTQYDPSVLSVPAYLNQITQRLTALGKDIKTYPFYSTEYGWPTYPGYSWSTSYENQARYIVRSSLLQLGSYVKKVMPYKYNEIMEDNVFENSYGMYRMDYNAKPSLWTYSVLAKKIGNAQYQGYINFGAQKNVICLVFKTSSNATILAAWSAEHDSYSANLGSYVSGSQLTDMYGATSTASSNTITIGKSPVYLNLSVDPSSTNFINSITAAGGTFNSGQVVPASLFTVSK